MIIAIIQAPTPIEFILFKRKYRWTRLRMVKEKRSFPVNSTDFVILSKKGIVHKRKKANKVNPKANLWTENINGTDSAAAPADINEKLNINLILDVSNISPSHSLR